MSLVNTNAYNGGKTFLGVSNSSPVNCIFCWFLYFICMWLCLFFGILVLMVVVLLCQNEIGAVVKWFKAALTSYLFNTPWPTQTSQQNQQVESFIDTKKERLGSRFEEFWECPMCLEEFKPDDEIIALKCHERHIYHVDCLETALKTC